VAAGAAGTTADYLTVTRRPIPAKATGYRVAALHDRHPDHRIDAFQLIA
jgi:hypothetical protein